MQKALTLALVALCLFAQAARAVEAAPQPQLSVQLPQLSPFQPALTLAEPAPQQSSALAGVLDNAETTLERALNYIGVRYKRGGNSPETGFDCSGFVKYLYNETLGLVLPHNAKAIAQQTERIDLTELRPGDLVFFNTMRRAFSHVGIYLGDNLFIHAPRKGAKVRIEDMSDRYWSRRYNGARRVQQ